MKIGEDVADNGQVVLCGFYHRYWNPDKTRNQAFDMFSGRILDVKERGIAYFFQQLDEEICKDVSVCVVPSHTNDSGIAELARRLARNDRVDKVDYLIGDTLSGIDWEIGYGISRERLGNDKDGKERKLCGKLNHVRKRMCVIRSRCVIWLRLRRFCIMWEIFRRVRMWWLLLWADGIRTRGICK